MFTVAYFQSTSAASLLRIRSCWLVKKKIPKCLRHETGIGKHQQASKHTWSGLPKNQGHKRAGTDFWSQVDHWFEEAKEEHGNDFSSDAWKV